MKRRMLSVLLSVMLVIATICVSNMPSRAVEPDNEMTQDETTQGEMVTAEVLSNSEVVVTEELTEETTEADKKTSESITSTETIVDEENSEPQTDAINEAGDGKNGQENGDGITINDVVDFDAGTETVEDIENDEMSAPNDNEDMMLSDEEATEEVQEEITEEMLEGAEVEKLENVSITSWGWGPSEGKKEYEIFTEVHNYNEYDVYLSCLRGYVTDEKGNEYNVPVSVKSDTSPLPGLIDITNDTKGYWGYNNESVLTNENLLVPFDGTAREGAFHFIFCYTVPEELEGNFSAYIYAEVVRLDDTSGKVVALCSHSGTYFEYDHTTKIENSNYSISERGKGDLGNVDINVYYDGNYLVAGDETNFYIQINNQNDFDVELGDLYSCWARENFDYDYDSETMTWAEYEDLMRSKGMQIIDANGNNITNHICDYDMGFWWGNGPKRIFIKAGETVTYRVNCTVYSDDSVNVQPIDFTIILQHGVTRSYEYKCVFNPIYDDTPTVSIDKEDENVPNMKLDSDAYESLINSAFTKAEINSGKHLKVDLIVAMVSEADVGQSDLDAIKSAAKKRKIAVILDMNIVRFIDGIVSGTVNQLDKEIIMTIDVPKEFQAANRKFSIIRLHDGIAEELPDLDDNPNTVTFTTGKFSLYALIYEDVEGITTEPSKSDAPNAVIPVKDADKTQQAASPNTGDGTPIAALLAMMFTTIFLAVICIKRIKKDNM